MFRDLLKKTCLETRWWCNGFSTWFSP